MITTLLFDLDGTLLDSQNDTFLPAYFQLLAAHFAPQAAPEKLIATLLSATRAMLANTDPARTLRAVFDDHFYAAIGLDSHGAAGGLEELYRTKFPALRSLTGRRPQARAVMEWAFAAGLQVGIATNPVYPLVAIEERLRWAGVGHADFAYAIVPSYETMRFAKPRPEYYAELVAKLGRRAYEALMIGDDWLNDIAPASAAGMHTYWIAAPHERPTTEGLQPDGRGTLGDFLRWARDNRCLETLAPGRATPAALLAALGGNLAAVHGVAQGVGDWKRRPATGEWSLTEVLCHLRDVETEVNLPRLQRLAAETEPFVSAADTDPWAVARDYQAQDGRAGLAEFSRARQATLDFLRFLPPGFWSRPARHALLGRTTTAELITFTAEHDRMHLRQILAL